MQNGESIEEPALRHIRREARFCAWAWLAATIICCGVSYWLGYSKGDQILTRADVHPIAGIPAWFVWGVLAPWVGFGVVNIVFALGIMKTDQLGEDRAPELDRVIHETALGDELGDHCADRIGGVTDGAD